RGDRVGRYIILSPVRSGGMGVVYAAYDPELDRKIALKLLHPSSDDPGRQVRLAREAQAMARISHPNVMAVHDVGLHGDQVFITMDLVEGGRTIRDWLLEQRPSWRQVLEVMLAAARGLAAAHAVGLVHRDFKPENVLMPKDGRVLVTDFGLARLAEAEPVAAADPKGTLRALSGSHLASTLTHSSALVGTPLYMAPEQYTQPAPDARSDQFSFCTTLYFALFSQRPFEPAELASEALKQREPGTSGAPASLIRPPPRRPRVPGWIKRALLRGLSFQPAERFRSMDELIEHLSHPPVSTRVARAAAVVLVLAAAGVMYQAVARSRAEVCNRAEAQLAGVWDGQLARQVETAFLATKNPEAASVLKSLTSALDTYAREWAGMRREACEATRVRGVQTEGVLGLRMTCLDRRLEEMGELTKLLAHADAGLIDHALVAVGGLPPVSDCANVAALSAPVAPREDASLRGGVANVHLSLARSKVLESAGKFTAAWDQAAQAVTEAASLSHAPLLAEALAQQGACSLRLGRGKEAEELLRRAWLAAEDGRHDQVRVQVAAYLTFTMARLQQRPGDGLLWGELGQGSLKRLGPSPHLEVLLRMNIASALEADQQYARAREEGLRALELSEKALGADFHFRPALLNNLAMAYEGEHRYALAAETLEKALASGQRQWGAQHPDLGVWHCNAADLYRKIGEYELAQRHLTRALPVLARSGFQPDSIEVAFVESVQGNILVRLGRPAQALPHLRRSLGILEKLPGGHPSVFLAETLEGLASVYIDTGRAAEALPLLEKARATLGAGREDARPEASFQLARALRLTGGNRMRVLALATQAVEGFRARGLTAQSERVESWMRGLPR
ncbi:MAG TPA: serine/threonine-protein kinase, partial [Myxococcaceae bacterium]|nr:serine/threonine-protein kinase [Myxococcaceae bacterium]